MNMYYEQLIKTKSWFWRYHGVSLGIRVLAGRKLKGYGSNYILMDTEKLMLVTAITKLNNEFSNICNLARLKFSKGENEILSRFSSQ